MAKDKKTNHLSIFLIKTQYEKSEEVIDYSSCGNPKAIPLAGYGNGQLFIKKSAPVPPKWTSLFIDYISLSDLLVSNLAAAFFIKIEDRCYVLAFGQGGRFLIKDDVYEERFGLVCALNSVDPASFRCVDVQSLDALDSQTRIQSNQETTPDQFGLDVEQDMLKAIVGTPKKLELGSRMTGNDSLTVTVKMDLSDLPSLLKEYRANFEKALENESYQWVNNISKVKSSAVIEKLEIELDSKLQSQSFTNLWLAIPDIIEWDKVKGFSYTNGKKAVVPDINLEGFIETVSNEAITLDLMRKRKVWCVDADFNKTFKCWSVFRCLYAEVDLDGKKYILNDGQWFNVAPNFADNIHIQFDKIQFSSMTLPDYKGGGEGKYNENVVTDNSSQFALLDKKLIIHGGGYGKAEVCDLLSVKKELIHVKIYGKSSVFSHLFAQGFVSGQLIQLDSEFRKKVIDKLSPPFDSLLSETKRPETDEFTIVFAVISEDKSQGLNLPFFSKVNLINTEKLLKGYGYKVELLKINVDEVYAKTKEIPPKKQKGSK